LKISSPIFEWEVDLLQWLSEHRNGFIDVVMQIFNFTGEVMFFALILPLIYWVFSKRVGLTLALVMFSSFYINVFLKDLFQVPRPFVAYPERITPQFTLDSYSFPSGHAQHSLSFWGLFAALLRIKWLFAAIAVIVLGVGTARMYAGVHYPSDVVTGWIVAIFILGGAHLINGWLTKHQLSTKLLIAIAILAPVVLIPLYHLISGAGADHEGAYQAAGLLAFSILGYAWEREKLRFVIPKKWSRRLIAFVIGVIGLLVIKEGLKLITPDHYWMDFVRYGLLGLWTIAIAPWIFIKLRLYTSNDRQQLS
jgi:membrane-associated phospholipid phosphatase